MYKNMEFARLYLNEVDIKPFTSRLDYHPLTVVLDNEIGQISVGNTSVTWKNIDLRSVMGSMWGKYDIYSLELVQFHTIPFSNLSTNTFPNPFSSTSIRERGLVDVYIEGLNWVNSSYSTARKCNTTMAHLCTLSEYSNNPEDTQPYWSNFDEGGVISPDGVQVGQLNPLLFTPHSQYESITIRVSPNIVGRPLVATDTGIITSQNQIFPQFRLSFVIKGRAVL